jgi:hypothetical protein
MTPKNFSTPEEVVEHCHESHARLRDVVTDLHRDPPRVYLICEKRTYMVRPEDLVALQSAEVLPADITRYFVEQRLLPVTIRS